MMSVNIKEAGSVAALTSFKHVKCVGSTFPVNSLVSHWLVAFEMAVAMISRLLAEAPSMTEIPLTLGGAA